MKKEDIEEAAEEYIANPDNVSGVDFSDLVNIFIAGARWAEAQSSVIS